MPPTLSIAIPTYNMEPWLADAIESCLWQTHHNIEVLVINDGSTDRSGDIAEQYSRIDSRVRHIYQSNQGLGKARQKGQDEAKGDYITWLDADDFLSPHFAERMLGLAVQDDVDMVCCNAIVFSDKTYNTRHYFPHPAASRLTFATASDYWKSKVVWRWIFSLPFLRTGNNGDPFKHPTFIMGQDVCFMYDTLTRVQAFSQCTDELYFFRQEHKSSRESLETLIAHILAHYITVKNILLLRGTIKPFVKYLNENYWRDIKKVALLLPGADPNYMDRTIDFGEKLFDGTMAEWFESSFLAPELKSNPELIPFATALRNKNKKMEHAILSELSRHKKTVIDKSTAFHTVRRRIKAFFSPTSRQTLSLLRELKKKEALR